MTFATTRRRPALDAVSRDAFDLPVPKAAGWATWTETTTQRPVAARLFGCTRRDEG